MYAGIKEKKDRQGSERILFSPSVIMGLPGQVLYLAACKRLSCAFVFLSKPFRLQADQSWCIFRLTSRFDLPFHLSMHSFVKSRLMGQKWPVSL